MDIKNQKGFTLIELALVLLVAGLIAAAIFLTLGDVNQSSRVADTKRHLSGILNGAQDLFAGRGKAMTDAGQPDADMRLMVEAGMYPPEIRCQAKTIVLPDTYSVPYTCYNPFGGVYASDFYKATNGKPPFVTVMLTQLPQDVCIDLVNAFGGEKNDPSDPVEGVGQTFNVGTNNYKRPPFTPEDTQGLCGRADDTNYVAFIYKLI